MKKQQGDDELNPRSCIVSRERLEKEKLIRFVIGPGDEVYPDLKETLPGRGVWVEAKMSSVQKAVEKRLFAKAFKQDVQVRDDLAGLIDKLLNERALQALAITKKSGLLLTGFSKVDSAIRSNTVKLLLHASDAAEDGRRKLSSATAFVVHMGGKETPLANYWSCDELSVALGLGNVMHAAALSGGATRNLIAAIERLAQYRA
jgi:predicted RNA-binding protein YlxR (DUF448 family)